MTRLAHILRRVADRLDPVDYTITNVYAHDGIVPVATMHPSTDELHVQRHTAHWINVDGDLIAVIHNPAASDTELAHYVDRIGTLLAAYGLCDVPDTVAGVA